MSAWDQNLTNLRDVLADLYWDKNAARALAKQAGLNPSLIAISDNPSVTWFNILDRAQLGGRVTNVIDAALRENPEIEALKLARQNALTAVRGADIARQVTWQAPEQGGNLEKLMGKQNTLLPISFLEEGLEKARAVVRVELKSGASGSGFVTEGNLLVTNHHVLPDPAQAAAASIQFNYQLTAQGLTSTPVAYKLAPTDGFATSLENDWTAVRIQGSPAGQWGGLSLVRPDPPPQAEDFAIIIQHPMGGPKQIALYHNLITYADAVRLQYLTDTLPGSSGSPVFDTSWQLIALHHSGGWLREPNSKQSAYRNEGITIAAVIDGLAAASLI
jgi:hypothetical protein